MKPVQLNLALSTEESQKDFLGKLEEALAQEVRTSAVSQGKRGPFSGRLTCPAAPERISGVESRMFLEENVRHAAMSGLNSIE